MNIKDRNNKELERIYLEKLNISNGGLVSYKYVDYEECERISERLEKIRKELGMDLFGNKL